MTAVIDKPRTVTTKAEKYLPQLEQVLSLWLYHDVTITMHNAAVQLGLAPGELLKVWANPLAELIKAKQCIQSKRRRFAWYSDRLNHRRLNFVFYLGCTENVPTRAECVITGSSDIRYQWMYRDRRGSLRHWAYLSSEGAAYLRMKHCRGDRAA